MLDPRARLSEIRDAVRGRFESQKRVLSFDEYLALFADNPWRHSRDAARYLRDAWDYFGTYDVQLGGLRVKRWRLFDLDFARQDTDGAEIATGHEYLVGQERLQADVYRILGNFVREGRINRLVLMHGPNGSAKSTFAACLMRALEYYSQQEDGALYRFSWIFPRGSDGKVIGFGSRDQPLKPGESYAHLPDEQIDVKLTSELRESPLLLLPQAERRALVADAYAQASIGEPPPRTLINGWLGHKNRQIFEALLTAYRGDLSKVLGHVRVERFYLSRRYRVGAVTIGPEMAVDAQERQISVDRSLGVLPASLSSLTLYETVGELVDASGGVLEFSDLLKRPLDAWRYLLLAIEVGEVSLRFSILPLNSVLLASSNELHLNAFKEHHEYRSFRGRLQMVRVPYLLSYVQEQSIYDSQIVPQVRRHVAPHATFVAALWAVLTRLRRPQLDSYDEEKLGKVAAKLTPLEKAELYALGTIPARLDADEAMELKAGLETVRRESDNWPNYEGLTGASPREIRNLLLDASQDPRFECLSPMAVLDHVRALCDSDDYEFLKEKAEGGYHEHRAFVEQARARWLERVDEEFRASTGLVEETQYLDLFDRSVTHVSYFVKNARIYNKVTGDYESPDEKLMANVEKMLEVDKSKPDFRRDLISTIAAHAIDNPGVKVDYTRVFPRYLAKLREATYGTRRKQLLGIAQDVLVILSGEEGAISGLDGERAPAARATLARFYSEHGYAASSARDALGELVRGRYGKG
ncbi:MAG: serine protein kinase PrkA [Sandaracinaceae bacterium]|nr:serine protein kinase PrkA [Sandaracinaceae bacterium]